MDTKLTKTHRIIISNLLLSNGFINNIISPELVSEGVELSFSRENNKDVIFLVGSEEDGNIKVGVYEKAYNRNKYVRVDNIELLTQVLHDVAYFCETSEDLLSLFYKWEKGVFIC